MAIFDVRNTEDEVINAIVFAEDDGQNATQVVREKFDYIKLQGIFEEDSICVTPSSVPNLIKALQKAVELGWDKK